jgi:hypothetical protein
MHGSTEGNAYDEMMCSYGATGVSNFLPSEYGYIYCPLPFWFTKHVNAAFPLVSCSGPNTVRFHITLRPFASIVRKVGNAVGCDDTPCGTSFQVRSFVSNTYAITRTVFVESSIPTFEAADILCTISHIDGPARKSYIEDVQELLMEPVLESRYAEPLRYLMVTKQEDTIKIGLPIVGNGPIRQMFFFLRRNASVDLFRDYTNYSGLLENEADPIWNPVKPLLLRAQLLVGTAVWADEDETWWRASSGIQLPGGIRAYGNYIYGYNFAEKPTSFSPSGSLNMSRVDVRLNLTVESISTAYNKEWSVSVFLVGTNWIRFQNGLANLIFMD